MRRRFVLMLLAMVVGLALTAVLWKPIPRAHAVGAAGTAAWRARFKSSLGFDKSPWHDVPLRYSSAGDVSFVCEVPRGSRAKHEMSKEEPYNPISQDTRADGTLRYYHSDSLVNYGMFPQTWEDPREVAEGGLRGDGDPMDGIDIGSAVCSVGEIYSVRVLGALALVDGDELDWKIIVARSSDTLAAIQDVGNADDATRDRLYSIKEWFRNYKIPDGKPANRFLYNGVIVGKKISDEELFHAHDSWWKLATRRVIEPGYWVHVRSG